MAQRVIIVDDHPLFASAVADIVRSISAEIEVHSVGSIQDLERSVADVGAPDLVLLDLDLPDSAVAGTVSAVRRQLPDSRIVCLSAHDDSRRVHQALASGAEGFLSKASGPAEMLRDLRRVLFGDMARTTRVNDVVPPVAAGAAMVLSARQREVIDLMVCGLTNKVIAQRLGMAPGTVKVHVRDICERLGVHNRTEAVVLYLSLSANGDKP